MRKLRSFNVALVLVLFLSMSFVIAQDTTPIVEVTLLNHDPDPVKQGDVVEVRFKIENTGIETKENVQVQILPDYPFSLYSGTSIRNLGKLRAEQSGSDAVIVDYKLKVDEEAAEGDTEIELRVKIGDQVQEYNDDEFKIDIEDYDFPDIKVYVRESDVRKAGQKGRVIIEMANTDIEDIKFLQLKLLPNEGYQLLSSSDYVYIGDIDSDDTESEEFEIYVESSVRGELLLPVQIIYQDTNELMYQKEFMLKLRVFDSQEAKKFGLEKTNYLGLTIGAIVILILGYIYWRRTRKKR